MAVRRMLVIDAHIKMAYPNVSASFVEMIREKSNFSFTIFGH